MKKLLLILLVLSFACKKGSEYAIVINLIGDANYQYQIGPTTNSGHVTGTKEITGMAHDGDYVSISAQADSGAFPIDVKLQCQAVALNAGQKAPTVNLSRQF